MTGKKFLQPFGNFKMFTDGPTQNADENTEIEPLNVDENEDGAETVPTETLNGAHNRGEVVIKPWFWDNLLMRYGIGQKLIMEMEKNDDLDFVYEFLKTELKDKLKGVPEDEIDRLVLSAIEVHFQPDLDASISQKKW